MGFITGFLVIMVILAFPVVIFIVLPGIRVLYQYERGVLFTLGKFSGVKEPGLRWIFPIIQSLKKVDMRIKTADIPRQEVITKDNITMLVNAVVYYKVIKPEDAVIKIEDYEYAVTQYTQAALRDIMGNNELDFVLTEREKIATSTKSIVDVETDAWGIDVDSIKIQEIELPAEMKRAIAKQAEAERGRRAAIITAEGELTASHNLLKAAENLSKSPASIHLRTLQTIKDIASDPSEKIVLYLPSDFGNTITNLIKK